MQEKSFDAAAWWLYHHGIRPDHFTFAQAPVYIFMAISALAAEVWAFFALQIFAVLLDGADGILARRTGTVTRRGHLLDAFFDIIGIGITLWAAAVLYPQAATIPGVPMVTISQLLIGLLVVNFLVYVQNEIQGTKSITYTRGPVTLGIIVEQYWPGLLVIGVLLPFFFGAALLFTRLDWRRRLFNWYQFLTAGRRKEYVSLTRKERSRYTRHPSRFPARPGTSSEPENEEDEEAADASALESTTKP